MTRTRLIWSALITIYAIFFSWYTSFGGPLRDDEIDQYIAAVTSGADPPPPEAISALRRFLQDDTGDDFVMVNLIDMYETPLQIEGVEPGESSDDVMAKYMSFMYPALFSRASHPVIFGTAANSAMDLMNADGMEKWTTGAGMRYRSRRDLMDIATNPDFHGSHEFKVAAMAKTIAFPIDPWFQLGDPRLVLALVFGLIGCGLSWREATRVSR
ncbi:hypothetical protein MK489_22725 [Myxococcota bacterium]|nr:hypothetical protein [Myxococcota bacterium]